MTSRWARSSFGTATRAALAVGALGVACAPLPKHEDPPGRAGALTAACRGGDGDACHAIAKEETGLQGVVWLETGCANGSMAACSDLGQMLKDQQRAKTLFERACHGKQGGACTRLGVMRLGETVMPHEATRARELLELGCSLNDAQGCYEAGYAWHKGIGGPKDPNKSVALLDRGCQLEHADACLGLGIQLEGDPKLATDNPSALTAYTRACELSEWLGCTLAGRLLIADGKQSGRAEELFRRACSEKEPVGCLELGLFERSRGLSTGMHRFEMACYRKVLSGCVYLGDSLREDAAHAPDARKGDVQFAHAAHAYERACGTDTEAGAVACTRLGELTREGLGRDADPTRAATLFRGACPRFGEACVELALMIENGELTDRAPETPLELYKQACIAGTEGACEKVKRLQNEPPKPDTSSPNAK